MFLFANCVLHTLYTSTIYNKPKCASVCIYSCVHTYARTYMYTHTHKLSPGVPAANVHQHTTGPTVHTLVPRVSETLAWTVFGPYPEGVKLQVLSLDTNTSVSSSCLKHTHSPTPHSRSEQWNGYRDWAGQELLSPQATSGPQRGQWRPGVPSPPCLALCAGALPVTCRAAPG